MAAFVGPNVTDFSLRSSNADVYHRAVETVCVLTGPGMHNARRWQVFIPDDLYRLAKPLRRRVTSVPEIQHTDRRRGFLINDDLDRFG